MSKNALGKVLPGLFLVAYCLAIFLLAMSLRQVELSADEGLRVDEVIHHSAASGSVDLELAGAGFHDEVNVMAVATPLETDALLGHLLPDSRMRGLSVDDGLIAVTCEGDKLVLMEQGVDVLPLPISSLQMPDDALTVALVENKVVVGLSKNAGVVLVDVADPKFPKVSQHFRVGGTIVDMLTRGSTVYILDLNYGLCRIDLNAAEPAFERLAAIDSPWRIASENDKLVVGSLDKTLTLFDTGPSNFIAQAGELSVAESVRGLSFCAGYLGAVLMNGDVITYDTSSWPNLRPVDRLSLDGHRPHQLISVPEQAMLIASLSGSGLALVKVSADGRLALQRNLLWPRQITDLEVRDDVIYAESYKGLELFSLPGVLTGDSQVATLVSQQKLFPVKWGADLYGQHGRELIALSTLPTVSDQVGNKPLWLADGRHLVMHQRKVEGAATPVAEVECAQAIQTLIQREEQLFVLFQQELKVFDWDISGILSERAVVKIPGPSQDMAWLDPGYLLIATEDSLITVLDVRQAGRPVQVAQLFAPSHLQQQMRVRGIAVDRGYAYLALGGSGIGVIDLKNPAKPHLVTTSLTRGYAKSVFFSEGLLWVADTAEGLYLLRVAKPGQLQGVGVLQTPLVAARVTIHQGHVFLNNRDGMLVKFPVPTHVGAVHSEGQSSARVKIPAELLGKSVKIFLFDGRSMADIVLPAQKPRPRQNGTG